MKRGKYRERGRKRRRSAGVPWDLSRQVNAACDRFFEERNIPPPRYNPFPIDKRGSDMQKESNKEKTKDEY